MTDTKDVMKAIASAIDETVNPKGSPKSVGFVVLLFPFDGQPGNRVDYISNGNREDVVVALKEMVARFEGQPRQIGRA
ncbi:hypothetical protein [Rhizobium wuzhouense]|uniref:Uncharacterized protein n=1 Tax=Rhizobium wuzhouense TaxID=1986026 RepID=A0ABX5NPV5_9HYPH|nr:hypothetical protein [Rhizobium wuzhouense]PYB71302.1 hypothetical protein DMY87_18265 [Rhizobium wuzhouense]